MNYMMDKIVLHKNKEEIMKVADELIKVLMDDKKLDNSEKLMTIELAMAKLNYDLYNVSGDK
ncbi:MAG: hypothetical protein UE699_00540 [Bacilli bacterium]|nr:hypothetical protein [Mycoplasmatota bacterium]MDD6941124.1 hypothetical protein [bacterium]MDY2697012.1 hypothetical protein [Bacilli bacterium]MDY5993596.1 hypothetical protein [Bacilli bacterium]MEE0014169.1 hypothetical protein [Bacilli bacterium]